MQTKRLRRKKCKGGNLQNDNSHIIRITVILASGEGRGGQMVCSSHLLIYKGKQ